MILDLRVKEYRYAGSKVQTLLSLSENNITSLSSFPLQTGGFFCPGVDGEFLPDYPEQLYANRNNIARIPVLMGFTSTEGSGMLMPAEGFGDGITEEACRQIVQGAVMMTGVKVRAFFLELLVILLHKVRALYPIYCKARPGFQKSKKKHRRVRPIIYVG